MTSPTWTPVGPPPSLPPRNPPWLWWLIGGVVLFALANVVLFFVVTQAMGNTHAAMDARQAIEDPETIEAIDRECARLQVDLDEVSSVGVERILEENRAVERFVEQVRTTTVASSRAEDPPSDEWLDDWLVLVAVRAKHASALDRDPTSNAPPLPEVDGVPITSRMNAAVDDCDVPPRVLDDFDR